MKTIKLLGSISTVATGALGAYAGYSSPVSEGSQIWITALGVLLIADSLACFYGANVDFALSSLASALLVLLGLVGWGSGYTWVEWATVAIGALDVVLGLLAYRSTTSLSEQANPMNLPVFG